MSESKNTIKNFIRTGQFSKRFNVSKPTDMPDIPEERLVDGRPVSKVDSEKGDKRVSATVSEVRGGKKNNRASNLSSMSNASTVVGNSGLGIHNTPDRKATHTPQPDDLMFIPQDIQTPTTFGPNNEYTAVPTVITYSSSGRGATKITVREANASDPKPPGGYNVPKVMDSPELPQSLPPSYTPNHIPVIAPPPNFTPASGDRVARGVSTFTQGTESIRSSTASSQGTRFSRTSMISEEANSTTTVSNGRLQPSALDRISEMPSFNAIHGHSLSTSTTPVNDEKVISEAGSTHSTLVTPPGSPPLHSGVSWPLTSHGRNKSGNASLLSYDSTYLDCKEGVPTYPRMMNGSLRSEFEWDLNRKDRVRNWFTHWFVEWWLLEIVSWIFSAACMITIAAVLARYDGKPLPRWSMDLSINAFISIFSGFAKSALLLPTAEALGQLKWDWFRKAERSMMDFEVMDGASRGALGSAVLLAKNKGVTLASVGAAIILLSLPMDLFFQQIVSYPAQMVLDTDANATISRAIFYDPPPNIVYKNRSAVMPVDLQIESFTYPFWMGNGIVPGVEFNCPTGNCTYDPFHTLALDFQCKEMPSSFLEFGCQTTSAEWMSTVSLTEIYKNGNPVPNVTSCGHYMKVPGHQDQLMSGYQVLPDGSKGEVLSNRFFPIMDIYTNEVYFGGSPNYKGLKNWVADFILVSTPGQFEGARQNNTPVITECEIHWVVKKIKSTVTAGILKEEEVGESLQFESNLDSPWDVDDPDSYVANFSMTLPDPHSFTGGKSMFGLDNTTAKKIWMVWAEIAPSTAVLPVAIDDSDIGPALKFYWAADTANVIGVPDRTKPITPWDTPNNVTQHMSDAVTVMNQIVRRNTLSVRRRQDISVGQAWITIVIVDIRWRWLSLPLILLIFSLMFLIATVVRSTKDADQIGIFKTSALAVLFNGLGEDVQERVGSGNMRMGATRERARDIKVHLYDD
ncbi:putative mannosyl-oligosaccharide glucosidase [Venturia nashicola]|uniref:Putative mannosyl-oligosaccharide glucosidase n=1 Tax=Venturia nashicola TaxID=86259 RepID=A0A4Z1NZ82_9PEZI|nr:putative mannosyl-oligosaccharide glucosidase [Venturia nashicola]